MARPHNPRGGRPRTAPRVERRCEACGAPFVAIMGSRPKRSCSRVCADRLRAKASSSTQSQKIHVTCEECGRQRLVSPAYRVRRYCSVACAAASNTGVRNGNWRGGATSERQTFYTSSEWRDLCNQVWRRDGASCRRCGKAHVYPERGFEVHHIAGWTAFPSLRRDLGNLVLLCGYCHRFVHSRRNTSSEFIRRSTDH
ncbi:HNH endonuclease [Vannielia litorea]|uniref:HNH endonuclease n=1 Tax=Vannielia litorea TaxID=1217970 RepID=UPI001BCB74D8|nr:hypothetical protein [Vannielia litorea]